jgi:glucose-6-phosphate 1-epimerase
MQQPPYWIIQDDGGYWLVPARENGWHERTPFVGRIGHLQKLDGVGTVDLGFDKAHPKN